MFFQDCCAAVLVLCQLAVPELGLDVLVLVLGPWKRERERGGGGKAALPVNRGLIGPNGF